MTTAAAYMLGQTFKDKFTRFCQMDTIPDI
jgi:hypothetical protein